MSVFSAGNVMNVSVEGLEEAQRTLARMDEAARGDRGMRGSLTLALIQMHRYATGIVHVDTGRLKNSLFWAVAQANRAGASGVVATNVAYAQAEHSRGGSHAFFSRTVREEGRHINSLFAAQIERSLHRG